MIRANEQSNLEPVLADGINCNNINDICSKRKTIKLIGDKKCGNKWQMHQSVAQPVSKFQQCKYIHCLGYKKKKNKDIRPYVTKHLCEECTVKRGEETWYCNDTKVIDGIHKTVTCHIHVHQRNCRKAKSVASEENISP